MRILIITGGRIDEDFALSLLEKEKFEHIDFITSNVEGDPYSFY